MSSSEIWVGIMCLSPPSTPPRTGVRLTQGEPGDPCVSAMLGPLLQETPSLHTEDRPSSAASDDL